MTAVRVLRRFRDLKDVTFGTPADGDAVVYDAASDELVLAAAASGGGGAPSGPAGGVLSGTYPNPGFAQDMATQTELNSVNAALGNYQPLDSDLTAIAALTTTAYGRGLLALADAAALRTTAGLGTAATQNTTAFDAAGAAAAAQAASQPIDSDLTAIAALTTTSFGRSLLALADAAAAQVALGVAAAVGGTVWTVVTKAADESVTSSITFQQDNELLFTTVSGAVYEISAVIVYASPAGAGTPDLTITAWEDAVLRGAFATIGLGSADTAQVVAATLDSASIGRVGGTAATNRALLLQGTFVAGGGTFAVQWCQATSSASATIVRAGSLLRYRRIV